MLIYQNHNELIGVNARMAWIFMSEISASKIAMSETDGNCRVILAKMRKKKAFQRFKT